MVTVADLVSVIMPAYNCAGLIGEALASVAAQSYRPIELVVVDDGSVDATAQVMHAFAERARGGEFGDFAVRCLHQANGGPSRARNAGISAARGEFVSMLDSDDRWPAGKAAAEVGFLKAHPEVALVFGDAQIFSEKGVKVESLFRKGNYLGGVLDNPGGISDCFGKLLDYDLILTGTEMIRRVCLEAVGLYDESFRYAEDIHLWLRIAARYPVGFIPELFLYRRIHDANSSQNFLAVNGAGLRLREGLDREFPELIARNRRRWHRQVADTHFQRAYFLFQEGELAEARKSFGASLSRDFRMKTLAYYLSTYFDAATIDRAKRLKNRRRPAASADLQRFHGNGP